MQKTRALAWADDSVGKVLASQAQESELEPRNSRKNLAGSHLYAQHWGQTKTGRAMGPVSPAKPEALGSVENPVSKNQGGELPRDSLCSHHHMDTHTCTCTYTPKGKRSTALGYGAWVLSNPHPPPKSPTEWDEHASLRVWDHGS